MTRQTNIGLLLALIFIVAFSLVLTEFRKPTEDIDAQAQTKVDESYYQNTAPGVAMEHPTVRPELRRRVSVTPPRPSAPAAREVVTVQRVPDPRPATPQRPERQRPAIDFTGRMLPSSNTPPQYRERTIEQFAREVASSGNQPQNTRRVYIVIKGDNLSKISRKVYNSDEKWRKIFDANRNKLRNPDDIQVGMKLVIPEV